MKYWHVLPQNFEVYVYTVCVLLWLLEKWIRGEGLKERVRDITTYRSCCWFQNCCCSVAKACDPMNCF